MKHPFEQEQENYYGFLNAIKEKDYLEPSSVSQLIKELLSMLLDKNPETRSDAASLL